nr:subclass B1 metallo-beta-lactamase [uncultured bacterium]
MWKMVIFICSVCYSSLVSGQKLMISEINDSTFVYTTYNTYKNQQVPANGLLKVTSTGVVMIDTPWDTTQFQPLLDSISSRFQKPVNLVIATHAHDDRTAGLDFYKKKGIPTFTSRATAQICFENEAPQPEFTFLKDTVFNLNGTLIQTYFPGAGHAPDNIVIWFPNDKVLFGGCFLKSTDATDLGNLSDANLGAWPFAISNVKDRYENARVIIPGHGSWEHNAIKHTQKLLRQRLRSRIFKKK